MVFAKTGMGRMPSNCDQCKFICSVDNPAKPLGCVIKKKPVNAHTGRPAWCPLKEILEPRKGEKSAAQIWAETEERCEQRTLEYLDKLVAEKNAANTFPIKE